MRPCHTLGRQGDQAEIRNGRIAPLDTRAAHCVHDALLWTFETTPILPENGRRTPIVRERAELRGGEDVTKTARSCRIASWWGLIVLGPLCGMGLAGAGAEEEGTRPNMVGAYGPWLAEK